MRIALLADVHGNLEALEAVLIALDDHGVDRIVVLGDVVGYGPDPVACIYRLREAAGECLLGNHDQAVVDTRHIHEFNAMARDTLLSTLDMVGTDEIDYLRSFSLRAFEQDAVFAHANPVDPESWQALFLLEHVDACLARLEQRIAFVGHTHHPRIHCRVAGNSVPLTSSETAIGRHRYLVDVGSVGQPRDADPRAAFALWDVDNEHVALHRVEYRVTRTQEKIRRLGWPDYVAERLGRGE